jgi:hypothetical protein
MKQITLDNQAHPTLLVALWKLEKTIEEGKMNKAKKKLTELIEMVRYSDIPNSDLD